MEESDRRKNIPSAIKTRLSNLLSEPWTGLKKMRNNRMIKRNVAVPCPTEPVVR